MSDVRSHYEGCLLGLAIGDALGAPAESLSYDEIRTRWPPDGIRSFYPFRGLSPGSYTDDTEMSIAVARGLLGAEDFGTESIMESMTRAFINWLENTDSTRSPGNSCMRGVNNLKSGIHWSESGVVHSKGCGTAMRAAPIGLAYPHAIDALTNMASHVSLMTHGHPCATAGSFATAFLVARSLDGTNTADILVELIRKSARISEEFAKYIMRVPIVLGMEDLKDAHIMLGAGWVAEEAVAGAVYANIKHPYSFKDCVLEAANSGGDTDSKACIAGAIAGARLGRDALPTEWVEGVEDRTLLIDLAKKLFKLQKELEQI